MKKILGILTMLTVLTFVGTAFALDYSDATLGYDVATAADGTWNRLGAGWTNDSSAAAVAGNFDADDGVLWSTNGGVTWGNDDITVGDTVKFQFTLSKVEWGRHTADHLKAWIDWNNDRDFKDSGEVILSKAFNFTPNTAPDGSPSQFLDSTHHNAVVVATYNTEMTFNTAGEYWLRARAVCNADVPRLDDVSSTGSYYQGEIEDWKLKVNNKVPEPASMILFGLGLLSLAGIRRKMNK